MDPRVVHVLTPVNSPNTLAFVYPLKANAQLLLAEQGVRVRFFHREQPGLAECDSLWVGSAHFKAAWRAERPRIYGTLGRWRASGARVLWFDTGDSTYTTQGAVLPHVDWFCKSQLLRDRREYLVRRYAGRVYTERFHELYGVTDEPEHEYPGTDVPESGLAKLRLSWHSGLGDYGPGRLSWPGRLERWLRDRAGLPWRYSRAFAPEGERTADVSCRVGLVHHRSTIRAHREAVLERMRRRGVATDKVPLPAYFAELRRTRVAVSPFGLGEITLRDFEILVSGAALVKPSLAHMETWPELFVEGETYVAHAWDLSDLDLVLDALLTRPEEARRIARAGQERYRRALSLEGQRAFRERVRELADLGPGPAG